MDIREKCTKLLEELVDGINAGDFTDAEAIPNQYTYAHLWALFQFVDVLDGGRQLYEQLYDLVVQCGKSAIRDKIQRGEKVRVAFLAISAAEWPAEDVYRFLEDDKRCESYVVVCPLIDRDKYSMEQTYLQTCEYLEQSGHEVRRTYDLESGLCVGWEAVGGIPDILIHLTPWYRSVAEEFQIEKLPLRCVNCYIPYAFYVADSADGNFMQDFVYNKEFVNMMWRLYSDSKNNLEGYRRHQLLQGKNVIYSGYAKMDYFFQNKQYQESEIREMWKIPPDADVKKIKKVIIAPHHTFRSSAGLIFSTFAWNMYFWLYLAKKYADRIAFIFKPHPNLGTRAVAAGVFESFDAYEAYLAEWNSLANAKVVQEADYRGLFATSDGMIMDSGSFLAEYMYVAKPMLFLTRSGQAFNTLGRKILKGYYKERGEDYVGIENFLEQVILGEKDELAGIRNEIFEEELNYYKENQRLASECIYEDISALF